ncbi:hypothetical protein EH165_02520 [Nakamurella antarctica]|uniref:Uncharacterized protein n=1 Tax=Nakamurella antarctica TaxID=1902245 RepID=A0A3G8ZK84_9ACTN|nr:DUF2231 domain-containing protein [Nakamurella antarctica]AZI57197.1 hypothetical protein EH165_02520 [Nakamurella antarctica]
MTTINGLPAHILLVHAIVVLLPLTSNILVLTAAWSGGRRRFAGANVILAAGVVILVPITTDAGEWLESRVERSALLHEHTELGDTALYVAIPVAVLALVIWWRGREQDTATGERSVKGPRASAWGGTTLTQLRARTFLAPANRVVTIVLIVASVLAAGATMYDTYRIGDSGAQVTWQDRATSDASNS